MACLYAYLESPENTYILLRGSTIFSVLLLSPGQVIVSTQGAPKFTHKLFDIKDGKLDNVRVFYVRDHIMYQDSQAIIDETYYQTLENGRYVRFKISFN